MSLLLTQRAAAETLGVSVKLVRRWQRAGRIPTWVDPDSGVVYFPAPALERWAANAGLTSVTSAPAEATCDGSTHHHKGAVQ